MPPRLVFLIAALVLAHLVAAEVQHLPLSRRRPQRRGIASVVKSAQRMRAKYAHLAKASNKRAATVDSPIVDLDGDVSYYTQVKVGTPPQALNVILDTGSSDLWFTSPDCVSRTCIGVTPFNSAASSTFVGSRMQIGIEYESGNVSGTVAQDVVVLGGLTAQHQVFGVMNRVSMDVIDGPVSGLMGLGFESISSTNSPPFWQSLQNAGQLSEPMMAFSLASVLQESDDGDDVSARAQPGGVFTLGGVNASIFVGDIDYVNVAGTPQFWTLPLSSMTVNNRSISVGNDFAAVDTGTTLIGGPSDAVDQIFSTLPGAQRGTGMLDGLWLFSCREVNVTLAISFGSQTWPISHEDFAVEEVGDGLCVGAVIPLDLNSQPAWIMGDTFLKNVYSVFRFSSPPAVGFATLKAGPDKDDATTGTARPTGFPSPGTDPLPGVTTTSPDESTPAPSIISSGSTPSDSPLTTNAAGRARASVTLGLLASALTLWRAF